MFNNVPPPTSLNTSNSASNDKITNANQSNEERIKRILELKSKSDKISKSLKIKGEKEAKKQNLILKNVMDDLDTKQQYELSVELNDKTKLNNIIRSMDNTSGMHVTKQDRSESALAKQKEKELEELQPYLKPELQFELDEDIKFKRQMELQIEKEIGRGNLECASELSDKLANALKEREINAAKARKEFAEKIKEDEEKKQKKPKLQWTFETKQRWETKGNM